MSEYLTGRLLANLGALEMVELMKLCGVNMEKVVKVGDGEFEEDENGPSLHPVYYVSHVKANDTNNAEQLHFWEWQENGGEEREWDKQDYTITPGAIFGPWGDCVSSIAVVKWFLCHGWHFESEGAGATMIFAERVRQAARGYDADHDDEHTNGSIILAALSYAATGYAMLARGATKVPPAYIPEDWPWEPEDWTTPTNPLRAYIIAGSLIAAEVDRIERAIALEQARREAIALQAAEDMANVLSLYPKAQATVGPGNGSWHVWPNDGRRSNFAPAGDEAGAWRNAAVEIAANVTSNE